MEARMLLFRCLVLALYSVLLCILSHIETTHRERVPMLNKLEYRRGKLIKLNKTEVKIKVLGKLEVTGVKPEDVEKCVNTLNESYKDTNPDFKVEKASYNAKKELLICWLTCKVIADSNDSENDTVTDGKVDDSNNLENDTVTDGEVDG